MDPYNKIKTVAKNLRSVRHIPIPVDEKQQAALRRLEHVDLDSLSPEEKQQLAADTRIRIEGFERYQAAMVRIRAARRERRAGGEQ